MKAVNLPFEDYLLDTHDEEIIWIKDRAFVIRPATDDDIERIGRGYFTLDYPAEIEEGTTEIATTGVRLDKVK
ncbi:hypothetical protein SAMN04487897_15111 [Paenibacillus sp. yr247]|uniref:hypothetical protein n=1 Tax=unclassified Paenibacillus TaxID=185978 RepID=UPI00070DC298|nr:MULTISPECIES: hypothetical protein [unclassified Paenibacillus]KQX53923.1 hypothetical protein ASD40_34630 [Paenibacillus sp. Root444D2]SDP22889.1 hypothetical protein SAMN04487897_15111 [Paenibacillus sp. yr247]